MDGSDLKPVQLGRGRREGGGGRDRRSVQSTAATNDRTRIAGHGPAVSYWSGADGPDWPRLAGPGRTQSQSHTGPGSSPRPRPSPGAGDIQAEQHVSGPGYMCMYVLYD